jgi:RNA polymerase sigma factor (sigma-70 family)
MSDGIAPVSVGGDELRTTPALRDEELVAAARDGDDRAFEALYARYRRRIVAFVQGMVHDHARAEDITQDVFLSALRRMRETDQAIVFKPWIYEIAKNASIDAFRRSRRAEMVSLDIEDGIGRARSRAARGSRPVARRRRRGQGADRDPVRGASAGLSETHHEILVMRELEGLSYREIGDRLNLSGSSVESTLFRAAGG